MNSLKSIYIALGSNIGDRLNNLQSAIDKIFAKVGEVVKVSEVYETPAFGFSGLPFYNACAKVSSRLEPESVLSVLLDIELEMGRVRNLAEGYQNRVIDLDVLIYNDNIINLPHLKIPHPQLHQRNFVLFPLNDIASDLVHPTLKTDIKSLKDALTTTGEIQKIQSKLHIKEIQTPDLNYICIEGNIGAGKTTFSQMLSEDLKAKLILERFQDNPFLPKFYEDPKRYAFPTEMAFLADRHQQLVDDISQLDLFSHFSIADYDLYKSLIFAKVTLQEQEFELYKKVFNIIYRDLPKPDLYVYFYQKTDRLLENIKKRGRPYEQNITAEYLDKINSGYLEFLRTERRFPTKMIDISNLDFVENRSDYLQLIEKIFE